MPKQKGRTHTHIDLSWKWVNALLNQIPPSNNNYLCKAYIQSLWIFRPIHSVKLYRQSFHSGGENALAKAAKAIIYPEHVLASRMVDWVKEPSLKCHQPFDQSDSFVISSADILNFRWEYQQKTVRRFPKLHRTNVDIFANVHTQRKQFEYTISSVNSIKLTSLHWRNAYVTLWIWLRISKWKPRENGLFRRANFLPATDSIFYHIIRCLLMMQLLNGTCRDLAMKNAFFTSV